MNITRRNFLATTAAASALISASAQTPAPVGGPKIKLGLIGCGGRGIWIADLFKQHGGFEVHAVYDYFADKTNEAGDKLGVDASRRFHGSLSGYKRLIESGVDAVAIISPPYFHPQQAADAVDAGLHVYLAKPIAVDVPGCRSIEASAKKAGANQRAFLVDFQTRATEFYIEAIQRVHAGDIGEIAFGEALYHGGWPFAKHADAMRQKPNDPETILRAWGMDRVLSGDIITEQFIHSLDVMNWVMQKPPLSASGACALKCHEKLGTCSDNFTSYFRYADNVAFTFTGMQFNNEGSQPAGIKVRVFGSGGVLETDYGGNVMVRGPKMYRGGKTSGIYLDGVKTNIAAFHRSIATGDWSNATVAPSVQSNLITILARNAAYSGDVLTWDKLLASTERLASPAVKGLKA